MDAVLVGASDMQAYHAALQQSAGGKASAGGGGWGGEGSGGEEGGAGWGGCQLLPFLLVVANGSALITATPWEVQMR